MSVWDALQGSASAAALQRSLARGAHAWLLLGPAGTGKSVAATCIAAALNCPAEPGVGCGRCPVCRRILRDRHPDVHRIVPEGPLIPVDTVRDQVIAAASRSPFEGRSKVFIIEEAERMNPSAQNALLKTLEEPHADTVFVLVSSREDDLLETIRSRCRVLRLEPVSESDVVHLLEREGASPERARLAARVAAGDLPRARTLAFDEAVAQRRRLWLELPRRLTAPAGAAEAAAEIAAHAAEVVKQREQEQKEEVAELAEAMGEGRGTAAARNALAKRHRRELKRLEEEVIGEALATVASLFRDALALRRGGPDAAVNLDARELLQEVASAPVSDAHLVLAVERLVAARASLARNANVGLALESALIEVASLTTPPPAA